MKNTEAEDAERVIAEMRRWVDRAVIGLNLCPFAKSVQVKGQVRYVVSRATEPEALLQELAQELQQLAQADPEAVDTTLLIHPGVLQDFYDFNDFLGAAEALVEDLGLEGELQVASFHPQFRFAGTAEDDIGNHTNRAPYPTLHLLREASIERAVEAIPHPESIYEANIATLKRLGPEGLARVLRGGDADVGSAE